MPKSLLHPTILAFMLFSGATLFATEASEIAKQLPDQTILFVNVNNVGESLKKSDELWAMKLYNDKDVQKFIQPLKEAFKTQFDAAKKDMPPGLEWAMVENAVKALDGNVAFAVLDMDMETPGGHEIPPSLLLTVESGKIEDLDKLAQLFVEIAKKEKATVEESDIGGVKCVSIYEPTEKREDAVSFHYAKANRRIVVTTRLDAMKSFLGGVKDKNLAGNDLFKAAVKKVGNGEACAFFNFDRFSQYMLSEKRTEFSLSKSEQNETKKMGIFALKAVSLSISFDKDYLRSDAFFHIQDMDTQPLYSLFKLPANELKLAKFADPESLGYITLSLDKNAFKERFENLMIIMGETTKEDLAKEYTDMETAMAAQGLNLKLLDLVGAFGNEIAFSCDRQMPLPAFLLAIEVKNRANVKTILEFMAKTLREQQAKIDAEEADGVSFYAGAIPGLPIPVCAALSNDVLLIGTNPVGVKKALAFGKENKGLSSKADFKETIAKLKRPAGGFIYTDDKAVMELLMNLGNTTGITAKLVEGINQELSVKMKMLDLPDPKKLIQYFKPSVQAISSDKDGFYSEHLSGGPGLNIAILLPALILGKMIPMGHPANGGDNFPDGPGFE